MNAAQVEIENPDRDAENYAVDESDVYNKEILEELEEQKEERRAIIEERERMVKAGEIFRLTFTPDLSKPGDVFLRYYDPTQKPKHYALTNGGCHD